MTVNYTTNLALGQPVTGTESGTWGDDVNNAVTSYLDIAIAGGLAITVTTADVTLTLTQGTSVATNIGSTTAQYAILNVSGAMTAARNLIVPSSSRIYLINNNTTGGFALTVKGSATSGVTLVNGEKAHVFWNGTDYAKMSNASGGAGVFSSITNSGLTSGRVVYSTTGGLETDSANLTFNGTTLTANTIGAFTLSGTIAGGGNQINNVIIGTTTPLAGAFTTLAASGAVTLSGGTANGVTYLNASKVLTTGSALTFDGTTLVSTKFQASNGAPALSTTNQTTGPARAEFTNTGGTLYVGLDNSGGGLGGPYTANFWHSGNYSLVFATNNAEKMRLDSSGNLGIGTTAPGYALDVQKNVSSGVLANFQSTNTAAVYTGIAFRSAATNTAARNWSLTMNNNAFGDFAIRTSTAINGDPIAAGTDRLVINASGDITVSTGNIIQGTAAKGINFTANTATAGSTSQLLNWYEEGTWTPVIADATSGGNLASAGTTAARYTRIGRTVFVQASFDDITTTGMTAINNVSIRGLPFASAAGLTATGTCVMNRVSYAFNGWRPQINPSVSLVQFTEFSATNANLTTMTVANILASGLSDIYFSITYTI